MFRRIFASFRWFFYTCDSVHPNYGGLDWAAYAGRAPEQAVGPTRFSSPPKAWSL
ncbi:hypothetical protein VCR4J5_170124 [Vibrio crassostreae]|uniref:Uncharacterized protein n=1 Tax=Vibrio crassostreae TaxID=246167 RepID=A0ABM9QSH2_9VIBR|nr:hypothetical protein VCR4J5_170124 [Vibrio crassostreae]